MHPPSATAATPALPLGRHRVAPAIHPSSSIFPFPSPVPIPCFPGNAIDSSLFKQWLHNLQSEIGILADGTLALRQVLIQAVSDQVNVRRLFKHGGEGGNKQGQQGKASEGEERASESPCETESQRGVVKSSDKPPKGSNSGTLAAESPVVNNRSDGGGTQVLVRSQDCSENGASCVVYTPMEDEPCHPNFLL